MARPESGRRPRAPSPGVRPVTTWTGRDPCGHVRQDRRDPPGLRWGVLVRPLAVPVADLQGGVLNSHPGTRQGGRDSGTASGLEGLRRTRPCTGHAGGQGPTRTTGRATFYQPARSVPWGVGGRVLSGASQDLPMTDQRSRPRAFFSRLPAIQRGRFDP